jgi:uncharacterized protein (DUF2062 family)
MSFGWMQAQLGLSWRPLLLGGLITATITALLIYLGSNLLWRWSAARRRRRRRRRD